MADCYWLRKRNSQLEFFCRVVFEQWLCRVASRWGKVCHRRFSEKTQLPKSAKCLMIKPITKLNEWIKNCFECKDIMHKWYICLYLVDIKKKRNQLYILFFVWISLNVKIIILIVFITTCKNIILCFYCKTISPFQLYVIKYNLNIYLFNSYCDFLQ